MRLSKIIEILENKAIAFYKKNKDSIPRYILILFIILYAAGFIVHSVTTGLHNFYSGESEKLFTVSITKNIIIFFINLIFFVLSIDNCNSISSIVNPLVLISL
mgnify:CR=1 FL=1